MLMIIKTECQIIESIQRSEYETMNSLRIED